MKMKKEYAILLVVIVALGLYLGLRSRDRTTFNLPVLDALDSNSIDRILIGRQDGSIELAKKDNQWLIEPQGYKADAVTVKNMLNAAADMQITTLAAESESYDRYDLNPEKRIQVKLYAEGKIRRQWDIGRPAPTQQHTFVRLEGDPKVYYARGSLSHTFNQSSEALRDKTVLTFERDVIDTVEIRKGERFVTLAKIQPTAPERKEVGQESKTETPPPPSNPEWQTADGRKVDPMAVGQLLGLVAQLKCDAYLDSPAEPRGPAWTLAFKAGQENYTLTVRPKAEGENRIQAASSGSPYAFWLSEQRVKTFEKQIDQLLAKP
jgi:hypothetical protein